MLKNYIKIAFRNLRKQKLYSFINIFGLTIGIAACIVIFLFIQGEYSFDRFHKNADNIYRLEEINYTKPKSEIEPTPFFDSRLPEGMSKSPWLPLPAGPTFKERFPEITDYVRFNIHRRLVRSKHKSFEQSILFVDSSFFEVFSFPLLKGTPESVLEGPNDVVLTPQTAQKYFGTADPVGQSLVITIMNQEKTFTVSGIVKEPPANSSIQFSLIIHIENKPYYERNMERWNLHTAPLFIELTPGADPKQLKTKLNEFAEERYGESWQESRNRLELPAAAPVMEYNLTPLVDVHLDAAVEWTKVSNPLYSYILGGIALLILLIACINYITLALARSSGRAKEVGIRKASGAQRNQIALQFWGETQLLTILAMVAGIGLAELALPFFNDLADKSLAIHYLQDIKLLGAIFGITLLTGLLAGSYPAAVLARYNPVNALKGPRTFRFRPRLTKALLVVQYSLSIFLIVSSLIMFRQMDYVSSKNIGYDKEQVLFIPTHKGWGEEGMQLMERFRDEVRMMPGVASVSGMSPAFTQRYNQHEFKVGEEFKDAYIYFVDEQFIETMGMELLAGRNFSRDRPSDIKNSIVVNQALVKSMGWENPVGEQLPWKGEENPSTVVGVVKDFHFQSLEVPIEPMLFHMDPEQGGVSDIAVKINTGEIGKTLSQLETKWAELTPFTPFNYWFLDDAIAQQYNSYQEWLRIMGISTLIAILIACMGLFGLAGITAVNKTKEIGIRKVLGAGIKQIILLLNKDLVKLIVISMLLAAPVSWYIMEQWLADFAYRIDIGADVFLISTLVALLVAIVTVSYHSIKAATVNPVESLRSE